jgi:hypothetical protein
MVPESNINGKRDIEVPVPNVFNQRLLLELGRARGLKVWVRGGNTRKVFLFCRRDEAESLLRQAAHAGAFMHLCQLEAVGKAVIFAGAKPSQGFLDLATRMRSKFGAVPVRM